MYIELFCHHITITLKMKLCLHQSKNKLEAKDEGEDDHEEDAADTKEEKH